MAESCISQHVSIIIPTRDNEKDLIDCLDSILLLEYNMDSIEVIIWDNNSEPESKTRLKDYLKSKFRPVKYRLIEFGDNYGVYTSRDELLNLVSKNTDYILSIDDDVFLPPGLLNRMLRIFEEDPSVGIAGPRIVYDSHPDETAHGAGFIDLWTGRYRTADTLSPCECDYIIGCCMLIKKKAADSTGGFDREYFTSHGEVDFCMRAVKAGYKTVYNPEIVVRHRVDKGGTRTLERMYYVYRNKLRVIKKNWPVPQKWITLFYYSFFWFPKSVLDSIVANRKIYFPEIRIIIKAMFDGWLNRFGKRI